MLMWMLIAPVSDSVWTSHTGGVTIYGKKDGLLTNSVYGVVYTSDGNIWVHSENGVFRFNGTQFRQVPGTAGKNAILANVISDTLLAVMSFDNTADLIPVRNMADIRPVEFPDSLRPGAFLNYIAERGDTLYTGSSDGILLRRTSDGWKRLKQFPRLVFTPRIGFIRPGNQTLQVFTSDGYWMFADDAPPTLIQNNIRFTSKPSVGEPVWLPGLDALFRLDGDTLTQELRWEDVGIRSLVSQISEPKPGEIWLATQGDGVVRLRRENGQFRLQDRFFEQTSFSGIAHDDFGQMWAGTLSGELYRFPPWFDRWTMLDLDGFPATRRVVYAAPMGAETLIITRNQGAFRLSPTLDEPISIDSGQFEYAFALDTTTILVTTPQELRVIEQGQVRRIITPETFAPEISMQFPVKKIARTGELIALATPNGLYVFDAALQQVRGAIDGRMTSVALHDTLIAAGRPDRFEVWSMHREIRFQAPIGVQDIIADEDGGFLITSVRQGIFRYDIRENTLTLLPGTNLEQASWKQLYRLQNGFILATRTDGLFLIQNSQSSQSSPGNRTTSIDKVPLLVNGHTPAIDHIHETAGYLWISTDKGIYRIRTDDLLLQHIPARLAIHEISVNGTEIYPARSMYLPARTSEFHILAGIQSPAESPHLIVEYSRVRRSALTIPGSLFSAEGATSWSALSTGGLQIERLPPGNSRLLLRVHNTLNNTIEDSTQLNLYRAPLWWELPLTWVLLAIGLLSATVLATWRVQQVRLRAKIKQYEQETQLRNFERVAVNQLLTSHYLFNALTTIRTLAQQSGEKTAQYINRLARVLRSLIDRTEQPDVDLASELDWIRDYLELECLNRQLTPRLNIELASDLPPAEDIAIPAFLLQPVFENALFHGGRNDTELHIHLRITREKSDVVICIENPTAAARHRKTTPSAGLTLLRKRIISWSLFHGFSPDAATILTTANTPEIWTTTLRIPLVHSD